MNRRRDDLLRMLAIGSVERLSADQSSRLTRLLADFPEVDPNGFEQAAAAFHLALLGPLRPMPSRLRNRLVAAAAEWQLEETEAPIAAQANRQSFAGWAAAAALLLALIGWWPRLSGPPATPAETAVQAATSGSLLERPGTVELAWTATEDATATLASGSVIWDNTRQEGFMRFSGLAVNEPTEYQYQLWIFDKARDERYPVDGGVFDVLGDEVVVAIDARVSVEEPYLFAVTVERPGGVVVSTRERIALVAQPS